MKKLLSALFLVTTTLTTNSQTINLATPVGSDRFGDTVIVLSNGNYVVSDPFWDNGSATNAGAVYLYNGQTNNLISTLVGSQTFDAIGNGGIFALPGGNFVVASPSWDNGAVSNAGAVTWVSGTSGLNGPISSSNSLVGTQPGDALATVAPDLQGSKKGITVLSNGNYVVRSFYWDNGSVNNAGAITWGSGTAGITGAVSSSNSLVGSSGSDQLGRGGITALTNGNYMVSSPDWDNNAITNTGAVTWGNGTAGTTGAVSGSNSLTGSTAFDEVGSGGVTPLSNGDYAVKSPTWNNGTVQDAGAATRGNGSAGTTGTVSSSNSLTGSQTNDSVSSGGITALTNGAYVVSSPLWDNGATQNAGAATWGSSTAGATGTVSSSNSLVGTQVNDNVSGSGVTALTNGAYVVSSPLWDNGATQNAGAATWGSGTAGISGAVSSLNSLVGTTVADQISSRGVTALANGAYVVSSPKWDNSTVPNTGAVTWGSSTAGISGAVSNLNSLVGGQTGDTVGSGGVTALTNGNYVVSSPFWDDNTAVNIDAGAATWGSGTTGVNGLLDSTNSLVGTGGYDYISNSGITALTNGNYVVSSPDWQQGPNNDAGAATWGDGTIGISGTVKTTNSLYGSKEDDEVAHGSTVALTNGNYVVISPFWKLGFTNDVGAVTLCDGANGKVGIVGTSNSLVGNQAFDLVGNGGVVPIENGGYIVRSPDWDGNGAANAGAVTLGVAGGTEGPITTCNSVLGVTSNTIAGGLSVYNPVFNNLIVSQPISNRVSIFSPSQSTLAFTTTGDTAMVSSAIASFRDDNCRLITSVQPSGAQPVSGSVATTVYVESAPLTAGGQTYVQRHYDVTPASNASTATGTLTLYFTQAEFNSYNSNNGTAPDLPTGSGDAAGKAALRIRQEHGTSTTGTLGSYNGTTVILDPANTDIVYNSSLARWEVTFEVNGFSGFFVTSSTSTPLPVAFLGLTAQAEQHRNRLTWQMATEKPQNMVEIARSADGSDFRKIGSRTGERESIFYDEAPLEGTNFYRLRMEKPSGESLFSNVVLVKRPALAGGLRLSPVPATATLTVYNADAALAGSTFKAFNLQGCLVATAQLERGATTLNVQNWPAGVYLLRFANGSVLKAIKQ